MIRNSGKLFLVFAFSAFLWSCSSNSTGPDMQATALDLSQEWETADPQSVNIDAAALEVAGTVAGDITRFRSLLVVRRGKLVFEEYYNGNHRESLNDVRSVTKSVVSTLTGIALAEGFINSLDESISNYIQPPIATLTVEQQAITIRHLLSMSSGFLWPENTGNRNAYGNWITSGNHINYLLEQPLVAVPGTAFEYNSAAVHLLGVVLEAATGMELEDFADQYLFNKIGITQRRWEPLSGGFVNGGAGIDLRPRDMARLGQLFLQNGLSGNQQVFPASWASEASAPRYSWRWQYGSLQSYTYGYLWWVEEGQTDQAFFAWGYGGQYIYVVPAQELVVVVTTSWPGLSGEGGSGPLEQAAMSIILDRVLPGVQ